MGPVSLVLAQEQAVAVKLVWGGFSMGVWYWTGKGKEDWGYFVVDEDGGGC